jgi:autotransporter-associated beta strand protein
MVAAALLGVGVSTAPKAKAANLFWDSDANATGNNTVTGAGLGGTAGTWDSGTTANWFNGTSDVTWTNSNNDIAYIYGGTAGAIAVGTGGIQIGGLVFGTTGYSVGVTANANTITFGAANNSIVLNNIAAATINGPIAGTGSNVTLTGGVFGGQTAGTLTLAGSAAQTSGYTGTTTINNGMTMALSANSVGLQSTSGITLNNGNITLTNTSAESSLNRVSDTAAITSYGGTLTITNTVAAATPYSETVGAITLGAGKLNIVSTNANTGGTQVLTIAGLTQSGTGTVGFSAGGGLNTGTNRIRNSVISVATTAGQVIGPWLTVGTGIAVNTDYGVYDATGNITAANITFSAETTWTTSTNAVTLNAATILTATRNIAALRYTGAAATLTLATAANLGTYGILNGGTGALTIAAGTGGVVTLPSTSAGNLYVSASNGQVITISAPINDNTGALTLVLSGSNTTTLSSTSSTYTGGTIINAGTLSVAANTNLGGASGAVTFNGSGTLLMTAAGTYGSATRSIVLNYGSLATLSNNNVASVIWGGAVTGTGGLIIANPGTTGITFTLSSTTNTFTGPLSVGNSNLGNMTLAIASLADSSTANGAIRLGVGATSVTNTFQWSASATSALVLNNRQFDLAGTSNVPTIDSSNATAANTITVNTDLLITGTGAKTLNLIGTNTGNNTFAGKIQDGVGSVISLTKNGAGTWILSGVSNTYSGTTTVSGGVLNVTGTGATGAAVLNNGGTFKISGASGLFSGSSVTVYSGGVLTLDNTGTVVSGRLNSKPITLAGGQLNFNLGGSTTAVSDTGGILTLTQNSGYNTVGAAALQSITLAAATSGSSQLTFSSIVPSVGSLLVSGPNLGGTAGTGVTNFIVTAGAGVVGGSGVAGSAAAGSTQLSIVPYIIGQNTSLTGNAQYGFVTDKVGGSLLATGIRNLTTAEYLTTFASGNTTNDNVNLATVLSGINAATTVNTVRLDTNAGIVGTGTLTVSAGGVMSIGTASTFSRASNSLMAGGTLAFGSRQATFHTIFSDLAVGALTGTGGFVKTGDGSLTIGSTSTISGPIALDSGLLRFGVNYTGSGAFTIGDRTASKPILDLTALGTTSLGVNATFGSIASTGNGNTVLLGAGSVLSTGADNTSTTFATVIAGAGALTKTGTGALTLTGASTYTGATNIGTGGSIKLGVAQAVPKTTTIALTGSGTYDINNFAATISGLSGDATSVVTNSAATSTAITIGPDAGVVNSTYSGTIGSTNVTFTKNGGGTLTLNGTAGTGAGTWTLSGGVLKLDYTGISNSSNIISSGTGFTLQGGVLGVKGRSGATVAQTIGTIGLGANGSQIVMEAGGGTSTTLTTGAVTATTNGGAMLIVSLATTAVKLGTAITAAAPLGRIVLDRKSVV